MITKPKLKTDETTENVKLAIKQLNKVSKYLIDEFKLLFFNGDLWAKKDDVYEVVVPAYLSSWIKKEFTLLTPRQIDITISNTKNILDHDNQYSLDKFKNTVYFTNGIYHLDSDTFEEIEKDELGFSPNVIPYEFKDFINTKVDKSKGAKLKKLLGIFGQFDEDLTKYLLEWSGSAMSMRTPFEKFAVFFGDGNDGKSTYNKFLGKVIGDKNISTFSLKRLTDPRKSEQAIMSFYGKTFVSDPDSAKISIKDISELKQLTGGDIVEGRHLYQNAKRFVNFSTIAVYTNHVPKITEFSFALDRRLDLYPMTKNLNSLKPEQKLSLKELDELMEDREIHQLFAQMALKSFSQAIKRGHFTIPAKMTAMLKNFKTENNDIYRWLTEEGIIEEIRQQGSYIPSKMWGTYQRWTKDQNNETQYSQKGFTQALGTTLKNDFKMEVESKQKRIDGKNTRLYNIIDLAETTSPTVS